MQTLDLLTDLIAFPTVSADPNIDLIRYCAEKLEAAGARVTLIAADGGAKANLFATIGPEGPGGVVLSGHTDVVPVAGQAWTKPPFQATVEAGRVYGRGTTDMKGFVASAMAAALAAAKMDLATPLHLALSYDEEVGCIGVRSLIDMLEAAPFRPRFCIVGEPTGMGVATGHKGKTAFDVICRGQEAHSALAPTGLNAIYLAAEMIAAIRAVQAEVISAGARDPDFDVDYTTLHVGVVSGGTALNIVPNEAALRAEIRNLASDAPGALMAQLESAAERIIAPHRADFADAGIEIKTRFTYPALETPGDAEVVSFVKGLTGANGTMKVAYGTEGGLFSARLGIPTVVCGPGSMAQGHKPDEFVSLAQLEVCDAMLAELLARLRTGL